VSHRFLPVLIVAIGLLLTFGVMGLTGIKINMAVIGAFPVLIGLGIDYAIQFHSRLEEEARKSDLAEAVRTTIIRTGPAVFYAMLATSMGFLAMFISDVPMIRSFGLVSMLGISLCYVASLLAIPTIALLIRYKPRASVNTGFWAMYEGVLSNTAAKIARNPAPILLVAGLVAVGGIYADTLIPIDTDENAFVPSDMPALLTINKVTDVIGSTDTFPIYLAGSQVTSPEAIQWMIEFGEAEQRRHDEIISVTSIATLIRDYNSGVVPVDTAGIDEVLGRIPDSVKGRYLAGPNDAALEFTTKDMEMSERADFKDAVNRDLASDQPPVSIKATVTGNADLFTSLINNLSKSKEMMTYTGFVLIFLVLLIIYRRPTAASPIIPIVLVVGWNAVAMITLGINYTPLTATLGSMTIGVAAEYTILVMERYLEEREITDDPVEAIRMSVRRIGSAITVSGLATFFGFSALILSSFNIISNFGLSTIVAVGFSLLSAILIMPAVIPIVDHAATWVKARLPSRKATPA
jgi:hydrophobe/amphiphile efflux-3 (HAE3) family protein